MTDRGHNNPPEPIDPRVESLTVEAKALDSDQRKALETAAELATRLSRAKPGKIAKSRVPNLVADLKQAKVLMDDIEALVKERRRPADMIVESIKDVLGPPLAFLKEAREGGLEALDEAMKRHDLDEAKSPYGAVASFNTDIDPEIDDINKVPAKYLKLDAAALKREAKAWDKAQEKTAKESENPDDFAREPFAVPGVKFKSVRKAVVR